MIEFFDLTAMLLRQADDQRFQLRVNRGAPWGLPLPSTVELLRHELAVPAEKRVGLDNLGHFLQGLLASFWPISASALRSPLRNWTRPLI